MKAPLRRVSVKFTMHLGQWRRAAPKMMAADCAGSPMVPPGWVTAGRRGGRLRASPLPTGTAQAPAGRDRSGLTGDTLRDRPGVEGMRLE